ncbi:protein mono-ADP-ribosyltransferase PARP15-like isoform X1 [Mya arenaria]|uniref:protein mono-ADP-ribosyltransferase PARP15-like isoform X1 n=1 Tax=Mya arenaria TaxID=6604 RepID=UPI0022E5527B|nr:protein mono-ADP-ribosyltransferase PARP15-like isoform X1 [Mya arenaria]
MSDSESTTSSSFVTLSDSDDDDVEKSLSLRDVSISDNEVVCSRAFGNITVSVVKADITELNEQVDVIVNTTAPNLDLTQGAASRALLTKGGRSIQTEVNLKKGPGKLAEGSIVVTSGGNLDCKEIYHTTLQRRRHGRGHIIKTLVTKCLNAAETSAYTSIAFPALGTGNLGYGKLEVARAMFGCVEHHATARTATNIRSIKFVIFPRDTEVLQAFEAACKGTSVDTSERTVCSQQIGGVTVELEVGHLAEQNTDVIMTSCTRRLDFSAGTLSKTILEAAGPGLQTDAQTRYPRGIQHGQVAVLGPGNIGCRAIYCGAIPRYDKRSEGEKSPQELYTTLIRACLDQASKDGHKSLSLPPLGTGYLAFPPDLAAHYTISAIQDFVRSTRRTSVEKVVIVVQGVSSSLMRNLKPYQRELSSSSRGGAESLPSRMTPLPERMTPEYCSYRYQEEEHPPAYWTNFTSNLSVKDWKVRNKGNDMYTLKGVDRPTFSIIERFIRKTWRQGKVGHGHDAQGLTDLGCTGLKVNKIERIENLTLFEQYTHRRQILLHEATEANLFQNLTDLKSKNGLSEIEKLMDEDWRLGRLLPEVNEGYLFHGTKEDRINGVVTQGLDPRLAQGHAVLGQAIYLAESSTKADQYTDLKDNRTKTGLKMFLVRACLGNIHLVNKCRKLKRPPCTETACLSDTCDHEKRFHSVVEEEQFIFREFVVYDSNLVYPEYLISYDRV